MRLSALALVLTAGVLLGAPCPEHSLAASSAATRGSTVGATNAATASSGLAAIAGPDATLTYGTATPLAGSAIGGLAPYTYAWSVTSAPTDTVTTLGDNTAAHSDATLEGPNGTVTLRLTVHDAASRVAADDVVLTLAATRSEILGSLLRWNVNANSLSNGAVASWTSTGSDTTAAVQATSSKRPVRSATALDGMPGVTSDGADDYLLATLASPIATSKRPYVFVVGKLLNRLDGGGYLSILRTSAAASTNYLSFGNNGGNDGIRWLIDRKDSAGTDAIRAGGTDQRAHVFEVGMTASGTSLFVLDGANHGGGRDGVTGGDTSTTMEAEYLFGFSSSDWDPAVISEVLIASDMPSANQKAAIRALLHTEWAVAPTLTYRAEVFDLTVAGIPTDTDAPLNLTSVHLDGNVRAGNYIYYFLDKESSLSGHSSWVRHNYALHFDDPAAWEAFDLSTVDTSLDDGFVSGCYDGSRYIYMAPFDSAPLVRFDTQGTFGSTGSYAFYAMSNVANSSPANPYTGCIVSGGYLYLPHSRGGDNGTGKHPIRYNTAQSLTSAASYQAYDTTSTCAGCIGYYGGVAAGQYVYLAPWDDNSTVHGKALRFDTLDPDGWTDSGSWTTFDMTAVSANAKGFNSAVYDGARYIYYIASGAGGIGSGSVLLRYDTQASYTSAGSYATFDAHDVASRLGGFVWGISSGGHLYTTQETPLKAASGDTVLIDYNESQSFTSADSYDFLDGRNFMSGTNELIGYAGVADDPSGNLYAAPLHTKYAIKIHAAN